MVSCPYRHTLADAHGSAGEVQEKRGVCSNLKYYLRSNRNHGENEGALHPEHPAAIAPGKTCFARLTIDFTVSSFIPSS